MPAMNGRHRRSNLILLYNLSDARIGGRERLVDRFLHTIENNQPECGKDDGSNASSKKSLHGVLPLRYSFRLYSK
jgi:hypothetical protein